MTSSARVQIGRCRFETSQKTNLVSSRTGICPSLRPGLRVSSSAAAGDAVTLTAWQASQQFVQHTAPTPEPQLSRLSQPESTYIPQQYLDAASTVEQTAANGSQGTGPSSGNGKAPTRQQHELQQDTAQINVPMQQQQQQTWQQHEQQQQQQQQEWHQDAQQQHLQQHLDRLLSNAEASTSNCAAAVAFSNTFDTSTSSQSSTRRDTLTSHVPEVHKSRSPRHPGTPTPVPVQQQQKVQVQPNSHATSVNSRSSSRSGSSSSSSNGTASAKQVLDRRLVRPLQGMSSQRARPCSPQQLSELSGLLCISTTAAQELLEKCPKLQQQPTQLLENTIHQLAIELGISYTKAARMAAQQPMGLLLRPASDAAAAAAALAAALGVPVAAVRTSAAAVPSLLVRPLPVLQQRIGNICSWFAVTPAKALQMVEDAPELLTDSGSGLQRRLAALRGIFRLQTVSAQRLAASFPSVLFMSPRIMNNKLRVLMAIIQKDQVAVGKIVYKTPQLLRMNLERLRVCYQLLPLLLQRTQSYVFAMMAHNGQLLLQPPVKLLLLGARLSAVLLLVPAWQQQWQQLRPPQVEEGFAMCSNRLDRLEYLVLTQQADTITLTDALFASASAFKQQFPTWAAWQAAVQHQQQQQRQQNQQQKQQQRRQKKQPPVQQQTLDWQLLHGHLQVPVDREKHLDRLWVQAQEARQQPQQQQQQQQPQSAEASDALSACGASTPHTAPLLVIVGSNNVACGSSAAAASSDHISQQQQQQCSTLMKSEYECVVRQQLRKLQEQHRQRQRQWQHHRLLKQHQRVLQVQGLRQLKQQQQQQRSAARSSKQHVEHYSQQHQQHVDHQEDNTLIQQTQQQQQHVQVYAEAASATNRTWPTLQVQPNLPRHLSVVQLQAVHHTHQHHQQQHQHQQWQKVGVQQLATFEKQQHQRGEPEPLSQPLHPCQQQHPSNHYQHEQQQQQHVGTPCQVSLATNSLQPKCAVDNSSSSTSTSSSHWPKSRKQSRHSSSSDCSISMQQPDSHVADPRQTTSGAADVSDVGDRAHELQWHNQGSKQGQEQGQLHMEQQRELSEPDEQQYLGQGNPHCEHQAAFTANSSHQQQQQHTPVREALTTSLPVGVTATSAAANSSQRQSNGSSSSSSMQAPWHLKPSLPTGHHWMQPQQQQLQQEEAVEDKVQFSGNSGVSRNSHPGALWRRRKQRQMQPQQQAADVNAWPPATVAAEVC